MITIAWYNVVAIIAGILFFAWAGKIDRDSRSDYGIGGIFAIIWLACFVTFYAIWGGIFWW
jgi:hypothetical protein